MPRIVGYAFGHDFTPDGPETVLILHLEGGSPDDPIRFGIPDRTQAALVAGILALPNLEWNAETNAIIARSHPPKRVPVTAPAKKAVAKPAPKARATKAKPAKAAKAKAKKSRAKPR